MKNNENTTEQTSQDSVKTVIYPDRIKKSVIYEVNIRQYTPEGTFKAFEKHLPRLKNLGVDILWFMPIQPIGMKNRKGSLGSYYSIQNYTKVNPEYGTADDFKQLVEEAHKLGMIVLIDWVANHTAWDNPWIIEHPDWYVHNDKGEIVSPVPDWTDVADLNYDNHQMRKAMVDAMKFWLENFDIDGFRCDVAMMVPTDFWDSARVELDKVKPVFMLAESGIDDPDLMKTAFDMNYSWNFYHLMNDIAKGDKKASDLPAVFKEEKNKLPSRTIRMRFTSNHDENTWNGTVFERMPDSYKTFAALTFVVPGMPLIYGGQEACLNKRLKFFDKDSIDWKNCEMSEFYKKLIEIRRNNSALWTNPFGADMQIINVNNPDIFIFTRQKDDNKVLCIFNLSKTEQQISIPDSLNDNYINALTNEIFNLTDKNLELTPWGFLILVK